MRRWEKWATILLLFVVVGFGVLVEIRSAFLENRKTDLGTYLRAAWAVRSGANMYTVTDENHWHYCYPPVFAILLTPLADAPADYERDWMLPYPVSVAIWYAFSILVIFLAVHWFAKAFESCLLIRPRRAAANGGTRGSCHSTFASRRSVARFHAARST